MPPVTWGLFVVDARTAHQVDTLSKTVPGFIQRRVLRVLVGGYVSGVKYEFTGRHGVRRGDHSIVAPNFFLIV